MKKVALILAIIFTILTFVGIGYVLLNHGQVSAGYAIVPMCIDLVCVGIYKGKKDKE